MSNDLPQSPTINASTKTNTSAEAKKTIELVQLDSLRMSKPILLNINIKKS